MMSTFPARKIVIILETSSIILQGKCPLSCVVTNLYKTTKLQVKCFRFPFPLHTLKRKVSSIFIIVAQNCKLFCVFHLQCRFLFPHSFICRITSDILKQTGHHSLHKPLGKRIISIAGLQFVLIYLLTRCKTNKEQFWVLLLFLSGKVDILTSVLTGTIYLQVLVTSTRVLVAPNLNRQPCY